MEEVGKQGRTVIFVSHNMTAMRSLCKNAILLENGKVKESGKTDTVINHYLKTMTSQTKQLWKSPDEAPGNEYVRLHSAEIIPDKKTVNKLIRVDTPIQLIFKFWNLRNESRLNFSLSIHNSEGIYVLNSVSSVHKINQEMFTGICHIPAHLLNDDMYRVGIMVTEDASTPLCVLPDVLTFEVHDMERDFGWFGKWGGVVRPNLKWDVK